MAGVKTPASRGEVAGGSVEGPRGAAGDPSLPGAGSATSARLRTVQLVLLWVVSLVGAAACYVAFADFVMEDAFITLRYARNLADGHGFVFTPGERVLGTTTPLYTILLSLCGLLGMDIAFASDLAFAASIAAVALLGGHFARRLDAGTAGVLFALLTVAGFGRLFALWGMETAFYIALLLASSLLAFDRRYVLAAVFAALAFLTRYDAALFALCLFAVIAIRDRRVPWKPGFVALGIVLPWLIFAQLYFGSVFPNTLGAKQGVIPFTKFLTGSAKEQLLAAWHPLNFMSLPATPKQALVVGFDAILALGLIGALRRAFQRDVLPALLFVFSAVLWLGYALIGPMLECFWYLTPAAYLTTLLALTGWAHWLERVSARRALAWATVPVACLVLLFLPGSKRIEADNYTGSIQYKSRVGAYDVLADWIQENELGDLKLMTLEPGYLTYRTSNPAVDAAGLVTKNVYFHGSRERRTKFSELIERHSPGLVVADFPYDPPYHVVTQWAFPRIRLLMRDQVYWERFRELAERYERGPSPEETAHLPGHPLHIDVGPGTKQDWRARGGHLTKLGRPIPLTIDGVPVEEPYIALVKNRPGIVQGSKTPPFRIDFDRLEFRFASTDPKLALVQLVVDGQIVLSHGGRAPLEGGEFELVSWPTGSWQGREATLRFLLAAPSPRHWLAADHIRSVRYERSLLFDDFEAEDAYGPRWATAFDVKPRKMRPTGRKYGLGFLTSTRFATSRRLEGERRLVSHPFVCEHDFLEFLLFDFGGSPTYAELLVDGEAVARVHGTNAAAIRPVLWDLTAYRGREATLRVLDTNETPGVWIGIDEVRLFDAPAPE